MLDLGLRGAAELIAYALIWGFCQDGESEFHGSATYVAQWCGVRREQAVQILRKLTESGLVDKTGEVGYPCHYRIAQSGGCVETAHPIKPHTPCAITAPLPSHTHLSSDSDRHNDRYILSSTARAKEPEKLTFGDNVLLTADEHQKLVARFGEDGTARLVEILDGYLSNPKRRNRYTSHYRVILAWCVSRLQEEKLTAQRLHNAQEAAQRANAPKAPETHYADLAEIDARRKAIEDKYGFKKTN